MRDEFLFSFERRLRLANDGFAPHLRPCYIRNAAERTNDSFRERDRSIFHTRPTAAQGRPHHRPASLDLDRLGERQGILKLDTQVSHGAVHLRMAQQKLNRVRPVNPD